MANQLEIKLAQLFNALNICSCDDERINKIKFYEKPHLLEIIVEYYWGFLNEMFGELIAIVDVDDIRTDTTELNNLNENGKRLQSHDCKLKKKRARLEFDNNKTSHSNKNEKQITCEFCNYQEMVAKCCISMSSLLCNLSFVTGNDVEMCKNLRLLSLMVAIILVNHTCSMTEIKSNNNSNNFALSSSITTEFCSSWYDGLYTLRQTTMLTLATISDKLEYNHFHPVIAFNFLWALIHFISCPNVYLDEKPADAIPSRQFSFEILSKISVHVQYLELIDQTPLLYRMEELIKNLTHAISPNSDPSTRNFSINLLSNYVKFNDSMAELTLTFPDIIMWLLDFIQESQQNAMNIVKEHGLQFFQANTHTIGTTPELVKKAAEILKKLSTLSRHSLCFVSHHERIVKLSISKLIEDTSPILVEILRECSFVPVASFIHSLQTTSTFEPKFQ